jgi:anti-sigma factor RsiW
VHDLVAGFALDALDPDDERAFERHLRRCRRCRDELRSLRSAAGALGAAAGSAAPPVGGYERVLAAARRPATLSQVWKLLGRR